MTRRSTVTSRAVTDSLLAELQRGKWRPRAWGRFLASAAQRSWVEAKARPRAAAEVTALHAGLATLAPLRRGRPGRRWVAVSWALAMTHLGMLESRTSLGAANVVTLVRANLPVLAPADGRLLGVAALASDLADGRLARRLGTETAFGRDADSIADAIFWTWFAHRHEPDVRLRMAALASWAAPVLIVTAISMARGRMIDPPRPVVARPAAAMQAVLAIRALRPVPVPPACSDRA